MLRFNTSKPGGERINFKEYVDRMKEGQNDVYDIYHITGESIAVVSSSSFLENLHQNGQEVPYMADPADEHAVQRVKEFGGKMLKSTTEEGLDLGDEDEKKTLEELKAEFEPLAELMKGVPGHKVEEAIVDDRTVDSLRVLTTSGHGSPVDMERIMKAQAPVWLERQQHSSKQQHQPQTARQPTRQERGKEAGERKKERKGHGERGRSEQEEKGREERESVRKGGRGKKEDGREAEKERETEVKKDVTDWTVVTRKKRRKTVQIFVKADGSKVTPMEVSLSDDRVEDVLRQVQNDEDVYVTMHERMLKKGERLKSCGVTDGCTVQVTSRLRGGGKHKDKKGQKERKRAVKPKGPEQKSEENQRVMKVRL